MRCRARQRAKRGFAIAMVSVRCWSWRRRCPSLQLLSPREPEVLTLVAKGLSNSECAEQLFMSEGTVKTHVKRNYTKLDLRDRTQAVIFAYDAGMVDLRSA